MVEGSVHPVRPVSGGGALHPTLVAQLEHLGIDVATPPDTAAWEALLGSLSRSYVNPGERRQSRSATESFLASLAERVGGADAATFFHPGTELPNGEALTEALRRALAPSSATAEVAVLLIGLDGLGRVGSRLGPKGAQEVVLHAARRIHGVVRNVDLVAHCGDDEFGVLLGGVPSDEPVKAISHRMEKAFSEPLVAAGHYVYFTATVGASLARPGSSANDALRRGRLALEWQRSSRAHPANGRPLAGLAKSA